MPGISEILKKAKDVATLPSSTSYAAARSIGNWIGGNEQPAPSTGGWPSNFLDRTSPIGGQPSQAQSAPYFTPKVVTGQTNPSTIQPGANYKPIKMTGNADQDLAALNELIDDLEFELQEYLYGGSEVFMPDMESGLVYAVGRTEPGPGDYFDDESGAVVDGKGTSLLQRYNNAMAQYTNYKSRYADKLEESEGAAKAFVDTESLQSTEADRAYNSYISRIANVKTLEEAPFVRGAQISSAYNNVQDMNAKRAANIDAGYQGAWSPKLGFQFPGAGPDYSQYANDIRSTIPDQAPAYRPYDVNKAVGAMLGTGNFTTGQSSMAAPTGAAGGIGPVSSGYVTAIFGPTNEPLDSGGVNKGVDYGVPEGTSVASTIDGTVVQVGDAGDGWGTSVKIMDDAGNIHNFGHLSQAGVQEGQRVTTGTPIALSGNTGKSTGPHLSYDVAGPDGSYIDPSPWVGFRASGDNRTWQPTDLSQLLKMPTQPKPAAMPSFSQPSAMGFDPAQPSESGIAIPMGTMEERQPMLQQMQQLMQQDQSNWGSW